MKSVWAPRKMSSQTKRSSENSLTAASSVSRSVVVVRTYDSQNSKTCQKRACTAAYMEPRARRQVPRPVLVLIPGGEDPSAEWLDDIWRDHARAMPLLNMLKAVTGDGASGGTSS